MAGLGQTLCQLGKTFLNQWLEVGCKLPAGRKKQKTGASRLFCRQTATALGCWMKNFFEINGLSLSPGSD
ncbi:MAG: hypothetical protein ACREXQ_08000, partial [Polaromonas sp.]